jgi:hypothetical protein
VEADDAVVFSSASPAMSKPKRDRTKDKDEQHHRDKDKEKEKENKDRDKEKDKDRPNRDDDGQRSPVKKRRRDLQKRQSSALLSPCVWRHYCRVVRRFYITLTNVVMTPLDERNGLGRWMSIMFQGYLLMNRQNQVVLARMQVTSLIAMS